jgi:hypothetical protein
MFGTVISAAGLLLAVAPGVASAANTQTAPGLIAKAQVSSSEGVSPLAEIPERATAICIPGVSGYNRFFSCTHYLGEIIFYVEEEGVETPVGSITFRVEQTDQLGVKSTTVTETDHFYDVVYEGETEPDGIGVNVTCGRGCKGDAHVPVPLVEGESSTFTLHFVNSIGKGDARFNTPTYEWVFAIGTPDVTTGRTWRCDDTLAERAGCVYASFIPTISQAGLRFIAASIRAIQAKGGPRELHRNSFLTKSNRAAVCNKKLPVDWKPPAGWPLPLSNRNNKPSCDEYPFAGTWEGGTRLPENRRGTAWVPLGENNSQGGQLNAFYLANRVLNATDDETEGDAFNVAA